MEELNFTANKRFMQAHYSYRDFHTATPLVLAEIQIDLQVLQALAAGTPLENLANIYYRFGDNARANFLMNTLYGASQAFHLWPRLGDRLRGGASGLEPIITNTYARRITIRCDQNAWVKLVSINPEYVRQAVLAKFNALPLTVAPQLLFEQEQFIPASLAAGATVTSCQFYPTYGYAMFFRADTVQGTMRIWVEGNMEGTE